MGENPDVGVSRSGRVRMRHRDDPVVDYHSGDKAFAEHALDVASYAGLEIVGDAVEQCAVIQREASNVRMGVLGDRASECVVDVAIVGDPAAGRSADLRPPV